MFLLFHWNRTILQLWNKKERTTRGFKRISILNTQKLIIVLSLLCLRILSTFTFPKCTENWSVVILRKESVCDKYYFDLLDGMECKIEKGSFSIEGSMDLCSKMSHFQNLPTLLSVILAEHPCSCTFLQFWSKIRPTHCLIPVQYNVDLHCCFNVMARITPGLLVMRFTTNRKSNFKFLGG